MRLRNKTTYCSKTLRKLFAAGLKAEGMNSTGYIIEVVYARSKFIRGLGSYSRKWIRIILPSPMIRRLEGRDFVIGLAQVFAHEVGHNQGQHHTEMMKCYALEVPWADEFEDIPFLRKDVNRKTGSLLSLQGSRAKHAATMLQKHMMALKRVENLVNKWRCKVQYYQEALEKKRAEAEAIESKKAASTKETDQ